MAAYDHYKKTLNNATRLFPELYIFSAVLLILVFLFGSAVPCLAADSSDNNMKTVRVAFPIQEGLSEIGENGNFSGYTYDYLQRIGQFTDWQYEFITFDDMDENDAITKAMEMVQNGEADVMGCMLKLDGMTDLYEYPEQAYGAVYTTLSVLENNADITEANFAQQSLRIAVLEQAETRRAELKRYFDSLGASYEEVLCLDMEEQKQALLDDRADALLRVSLSFVKGTRQVAQFAPRPYYFVTAKGDTEIAEQLNSAIRMVNENYPYFQAELYDKYFGDSSGGFLLSDAEKTYIKEHPTLKALYMTNNAPYSEEKEGQPSGILVSALNDFAAAIGVNITYTPVSSMKELKTCQESEENYDFVLGTLFCMDAATQYGMVTTNTLFSAEVMQFTRSKYGTKPMEDSVVALHTGCGLQPDVKDAKEIRWYPTIEECVKAVESGECDTGLANSYSLDYVMNKNNILCSTVPFYGEKENVQIYMLSAGDLHYLSIVNRYIDSLSDSQLYNLIIKENEFDKETGLKSFIQSNPVAAVSVLLLFLVLVMFGMMMVVFVNKLHKANHQLQIANAAKSDFLSRVSHDMRTPLNGILGTLDLMKDTVQDEKVKGDLDKIETSGKYLLDLINDTLEVSRIENGKLELHPVVCSGKDVFGTAIHIVKPKIEEKNITLKVNTDKVPFGMLYVDKGRLQQVLINIVGNSVKFTPSGGIIEIEMKNISMEDGTLLDELIIRDNGIGMSSDFLPHLFEPFAQEDSSRTSATNGTGLGMAITKEIVNLMDGDIHVESELGKGTCFYVKFKMRLATEEQIAQWRKEHQTEGSDVDLSGKRVLLCEDHPLNAEITIRLLEKKHVSMIHAENGQIGVEIFEKSAPYSFDAILMDIRMPVMDGLDATRTIRAMDRPDAKTVPIIAMSANAYEEDVQKSLNAGMNGHLAKPVDKNMLFATLSKWM